MYSINRPQKIAVAIVFAGALSAVLCKGGSATPSLSSSGAFLGVFPGNTYGNPAWDTSLHAVHDYERLTASKPNYVVVYHAFSDNGRFISLPPAISTLVAGGYVPVITWEAQDYPTGRIYTPHDIAAGTYDSYIRSYARQVAVLKGEVDIRLFHEQNGDWYGWGMGKSGASNQDHINAWRHIHDIFQSEGATNAKFVFNPNERHTAWTDSHPYADYYPGDAYVDYLALDGYNWADVHSAPWYSFDQLFSPSYSELTALSSRKPVMIAEYASHTKPGDKAQWIKDTRNVVKSGKYPQIKALLWFESNQDGALWRLDTSQSSIDAYKALAADSYYKGESIDPGANPACSDGADNDADGKIDFFADPGCSSATDTDETNPAPPPPPSLPPVAKPDAYAAIEDQRLTVPLIRGVLKNDVGTKPRRAKLASVLPNKTRKGGTIALSPTGSFIYTPKHNFFGVDAFTYKATNSAGTSRAVTVTMRVASRPR
jgi:mannan endo-1,4-beta-mannosidase